MPDEIREPQRIRQDCVRKLHPNETGGMFTAILGGQANLLQPTIAFHSPLLKPG
jgi:hypothetical protein